MATACGIGIDETWSSILAGDPAVREIDRFDVSAYCTNIGGQLPEIRFDAYFDGEDLKALRKSDLTTQVALLTTKLALDDAELRPTAESPLHASLLFGHGAGFQERTQAAYGQYFKRGWQRIHPLSVVQLMHNTAASLTSIVLHVDGSHFGIGSACASGAVAIGEGMVRIRHGYDDVCVVNGSDTVFHPALFGAWCTMRVLSKNRDPKRACRPFDAARDGVVLGEGSATLVLEGLEHAEKRGAPIVAEVIGYGSASDASDITYPTARGQIRAMQKAITDAGLEPSQIQHVNAHGTATRANDLTEAQSIKGVFGARSREIPVTANKSVLGHSLGAASAIEAVLTIQSLREQVVPPIAGLENPDGELDLHLVRKDPLPHAFDVAMSNAFAFGGHNVVLILKRWQ